MVEENKIEEDEIRKYVREEYGRIGSSSRASSCCGPTADNEGQTSNSCSSNACSPIRIPADKIDEFREKFGAVLGYSNEELKGVPEGANLSLGCGNPTAIASIKEGETVVDLGAGGGFDSFLAANKVGKKGKVIGVDMTSQMIDRARKNAKKGDYEHVEFRLGEIENLPVADNTADLIISNCVINLSPNKRRVFNEAYRVLKPGGRMMISDIVLLKELPDFIKEDMKSYAGCISGAILKDQYLSLIKEAGFHDIEIIGKNTDSNLDLLLEDPDVIKSLEEEGRNPEDLKKLDEIESESVTVKAIKPF